LGQSVSFYRELRSVEPIGSWDFFEVFPMDPAAS
jgi:hypothetical protein